MIVLLIAYKRYKDCLKDTQGLFMLIVSVLNLCNVFSAHSCSKYNVNKYHDTRIFKKMNVY